MRSTVPTVHSATELNIWQMAFKLTLLASVLIVIGYGFLFAAKYLVRLLV